MAADVATIWTVAIAMNASADYDVLVMDQDLPDHPGERRLPEGGESSRCGVARVRYPATGDLIARVPEGADASIRKPFAMDELVSIVRGFALDFA